LDPIGPAGEVAETKLAVVKWPVGWSGGLLLAQAGLILGGLELFSPVTG
jgi:hypothetical protein